MTAVHPALERLLAARGVEGSYRSVFLSPGWRNLPEAESLPGIEEAAEAILPFIAAKRRIVVFGDYDVDGICASAIVMKTLLTLGADARVFLPERMAEGYGMSHPAIERMFRENPQVALVVTVDNGISSVEETAYLKSRGVDVVITDHHLPGEGTPDAITVDPHLKPFEGCEDLCGAGVAYFLATALVKRACRKGMNAPKGLSGPLLVLAGLATVADVVPLTQRNRDLVKASLDLFDSYAPWGLKELKQRSLRAVRPLTSTDYGFLLSPRINASGRISSAMDGFDLVMSDDREKSRLLACRMDELNALRKGAEAVIEAAARAQIGAAGEGRAAYTVFGEAWTGERWTGGEGEKRWHSGVIGIVAGRLSEEFALPVAVVAGVHGSVRAPDGYNVRDALAAAGELMERYGGHALAGGFTLKPGAEKEFAALFEEICRTQAKSIVREPGKGCDLWLEPNEVDEGLWRAVSLMEPFGEGNPEPVFGVRGVTLKDVSLLGLDGKHLSCTFDGNLPRAVWWRKSAEITRLRSIAGPVDVTFSLKMDEWGLEMSLASLEPSGL